MCTYPEAERARRLQREGQLKKSADTLDEAMSAVDWSGLYVTLHRIAREAPEASHLYVETAPDLPVAIPVRIIEVARHRRTAPGTGECTRRISSDAELFAAAPCPDDNGRPVTMFDRPTWLAE
ncbi:MAG: hypothetical protein ABEN55_10660 [Bradymonadaceae bacterium]